MIIKRNERKRSRRIIIILCHGESPSSASLALLHVTLSLHVFLTPVLSPFTLSSPFPHRPNLHIALSLFLLFIPLHEWRNFLFHFRFNIRWERSERELRVSRALRDLKFCVYSYAKNITWEYLLYGVVWDRTIYAIRSRYYIMKKNDVLHLILMCVPHFSKSRSNTQHIQISSYECWQEQSDIFFSFTRALLRSLSLITRRRLAFHGFTKCFCTT